MQTWKQLSKLWSEQVGSQFQLREVGRRWKAVGEYMYLVA